MKCKKCSNNISDLQLIKSLSYGRTNCVKCGTEFIVREKGIGLAMTTSLIGAGLAGISSLLTGAFESPSWVDLIILPIIIFISSKYSMKVSLELE